MDLSGRWRFENGIPIFDVVHEPVDSSRFKFERFDGEKQSFHGHGVIVDCRIVMSWRSTLWLGHGSDESKEIKTDAITGKPIEIHWHGSAPTWMTLSN